MSTIEKLKQEEVKRAEGWKARAEAIAKQRAELEAEMAANQPETAVGAQAAAEARRALAGNALERIRARQAERGVAPGGG
jgi:hypothetical protein